MSVPENIAFIRRYFSIDGRTEEGLKQYLDAHASGYIAHGVSGDMNLTQAKLANQGIMAAFPDSQFIIEDIVAENDKVVVRYQWTGTNQGAYMGFPPTGKKASFSGISIYKIAGGKLVESWGAYDRLSLMQQLGLIPQMGKK